MNRKLKQNIHEAIMCGPMSDIVLRVGIVLDTDPMLLSISEAVRVLEDVRVLVGRYGSADQFNKLEALLLKLKGAIE